MHGTVSRPHRGFGTVLDGDSSPKTMPGPRPTEEGEKSVYFFRFGTGASTAPGPESKQASFSLVDEPVTGRASRTGMAKDRGRLVRVRWSSGHCDW